MKRLKLIVEEAEDEMSEEQDQLLQLKTASDVLGILRWPLPETQRTIALLQRWIDQGRDMSLNDVLSGRLWNESSEAEDNVEQRAGERLIEREESISAASIIGKSLLFELVILTLAWWVFVRRDY